MKREQSGRKGKQDDETGKERDVKTLQRNENRRHLPR